MKHKNAKNKKGVKLKPNSVSPFSCNCIFVRENGFLQRNCENWVKSGDLSIDVLVQKVRQWMMLSVATSLRSWSVASFSIGALHFFPLLIIYFDHHI